MIEDAVLKALYVLNAIRKNRGVETKRSRELYEQYYKKNQNIATPFNELKNKHLYEWHPIDKDVIKYLELSFYAGSNSNLNWQWSDYRVNNTYVEYPKSDKNIDTTIGALVDVYNGRKVLYRKNYELDQTCAKEEINRILKGDYRSISRYRVPSTTAIDNRLNSLDMKLHFSKSNGLYSWRPFNNDAKRFILLSLGTWDFKSDPENKYSLTEVIQRMTGVINK